MIKRFFEWILDRTLGWLWRKHEQSVLCDAAIAERAADLDFMMKHLGQELKDRADRMARDLFLDGASVASTYVDPPAQGLPNDFNERMNLMLEALQPPKPEDILSMIIVTAEAPRNSMLDCRYQGKRYALIHPDVWERVKKSIADRSLDTSISPEKTVSPLLGIPVVHDDQLAREVLIGALVEGQEKKSER